MRYVAKTACTFQTNPKEPARYFAKGDPLIVPDGAKEPSKHFEPEGQSVDPVPVMTVEAGPVAVVTDEVVPDETTKGKK